MIGVALLLLFGGMLWIREYEHKQEINKAPLGTAFYIIKYSIVMLCVVFMALMVKTQLSS